MSSLQEISSNIPKGMFRVYGKDNFEDLDTDAFFVVGDYKTYEESVAVALRHKKEEEGVNERDNPISATFYVIYRT